MQASLDIAAGIVIGGSVLALLAAGVSGLATPGRPGHDDGLRGIGAFLLILGLAAGFWLVFVRTGIVPMGALTLAGG